MGLISRNSEVQSGAYCIKGTRIPVTDIQYLYYHLGYSTDQLLEMFATPLNRKQIEAAITFKRSSLSKISKGV